MSDIECKLLSRMTHLDDITEVFESGLPHTVFEDPLNRFVFEFMMDYWQRSARAKAPSLDVMESEYPQVVLDREVGETAEWLIGRLQKRYAANQAQSIIRDAAKDSATDPLGSLTRMWQKAREASEALGRDPNGRADMPRLWNASDLKAASQPRWLARNRLPRAAVSLLVGEEGIGKSLMWVWLASAISTGKPLPEFGSLSAPRATSLWS